MGGNGRPVDGSLPRRWREIEEGGRRPPGPRHLVHRGAEPSRVIEIGRLIDAGVVRPIVESVLPLERAREAFERGLDGRNRGKLVLHVGNGSAVSAGGAMIP